MRGIAGVIRLRKRSRSGQLGFTMVELVVAIAISAILLVGSGAALRAMIISTGESSDKTLARLEVQYVNFWIGDDVVQATDVFIGNLTTDRWDADPFLTLTLDAYVNEVEYHQSQVVSYYIEEMKDNRDRNLWRLYRRSVKPFDENPQERDTTSVVAEYLDPNGTDCYQKQSGDGTLLNVLVLQVASLVGDKTAYGSYEISPRVGNETSWEGP